MFFLGVFITVIAVAPLFSTQVAEAWHTSQSAQAVCENNTAVINFSFTNTDTQAMIVKAKDEQTGKIVDLNTVQPGETTNGTITTEQTSLNDGVVHFLLTWAKGSGNDTIVSNYSAVSCNQSVSNPTPTATPSATTTTSSGSGGGGGGGQSNSAPVCSDGSTIQLVGNPFVQRKGSQATVNFFITQGDRANIYYKVLGQPNWQYSVIGLTPNSDKFVSYTINSLDANLGYVFAIQQTQGCGGGQLANAVIVDGPSTRVFTFSFWEWAK